jgi:hypothetical protein
MVKAGIRLLGYFKADGLSICTIGVYNWPLDAMLLNVSWYDTE